MAAKAHVLAAPPQLPQELYRSIVGNLHHFRERDTLLCLALVSRVWCAESQRVLFRTVCDDFAESEELGSLIHTHILFLEAIIHNPTRLGPYVRTYIQPGLVYHPFLAVGSEEGARSYLWDLTVKALPALVNLEQLFIMPLFDDPQIPWASLLEGCTFKLKSLRWGFEPYNPDPLVEFLRTQHTLLHLEVGYHPLRQDFTWLPDDVCPNLTSTACRLDSAAPRVMAKPRNIVGLAVQSDWRPHQMIPHSLSHLSGLRHLQYLSLSAHRDLMSNWGVTDVAAVVLELIPWDLGASHNLSGFPNLRVLALLRAPREERFAEYSHVDGTAEYSLRMQVAIETFRRCPKLEYIVVEDMARGQGPRRYNKLSIPRINGVPGAEQEIQSEEFPVEHELGMPWWAAYGVFGKLS